MSANLFARKKHWLATYKGWKHFILAWGLFLVFVKMKHRNYLVIQKEFCLKTVMVLV